MKVTLDDNNQYITKIETTNDDNKTANVFNVGFSGFNGTEIKKPTEFLSTKDNTVTEEMLKQFYNDGIKSWEKYSGSKVN